MQWRVVALLAKLRALCSLIYFVKDPLISSFNEPQSLQPTNETSKYLTFWFPNRQLDMLIMSDLIHCIDTHLWVHCGTLRQNWWIPLESNLTKKTVQLQCLCCMELNNGGIRGTYMFFPQQPSSDVLVQPFQCLWCNIVVGTTCRMIRMWGNGKCMEMQHPHSWIGRWYVSLHSWKS